MNSVLSMPSGVYKYAFRSHRLVVLPDYQGLGIGTKINEFFGEYYVNQGKKYFIRTTHTRLRRHLAKNANWRATSSSDKRLVQSSTSKLKYDDKRIAASYEYVGADYATKPHKILIVDDGDACPTIDELRQLKNDYYLTVATGRHKVESECETICKELGIRTELLYITQNNIERKNGKFKEKTTRTQPKRETSTTAKRETPATKRVTIKAGVPITREYEPKPRPEVARTKTTPTVPFAERRRLFIDLETYSSEDISKTGVHRYVEAPDFDIMLLAYAWNDDPVRVLDLTTDEGYEELPDIIAGILDPDTVKVAHNTAFERAALTIYLKQDLPPEEWEDTMILAAMNGLPMSLDAAGAALQLQDQKIKEGTLLINYFCKPCKPTIANYGRTRNLPEHAPDKWERFVEYCRRDVEVEKDIYYRLKNYKITDFERDLWSLDARINERGVLIDTELAESAIAVNDAFTTEHEDELKRLTGLDNPNSVAQLKDWLAAVGIDCESLNKETVQELKDKTNDPTIKRVLELRQLLGKASITKYQAMTRAICADNRVRGILQYYGAGRTGRWAGRLLQVQNLPQNHLDHIGEVRELVRDRDLEALELIYDSVPDVLSQLIRTALIAKPKHTFLVADYSAIEARVIAYLAGEQWRMEVFEDSGKIYEASYARAFHVPIESVKKGSPERQKGKIMELALGYGGGVNALLAFGADKLGLNEAELQELVNAWRNASPMIPNLWRRVEDAAKRALENPGRRVTVLRKYRDPMRAMENEALTGRTGYSPDFLAGGEVCTYWRDKDALRCKLPSGRVLTYWQARVEDGGVVFMGQNQTTRKWEKTQTWGGRLVENIVQAYARDCLAVAMLRLEKSGYNVCFHVHDEIIVEAPETEPWQKITTIMGKPIDWAPGLLLKAEGYETKFYMKD